MTPGRYDIPVYEGETWSETWSVSSGNPAVPWDLTGFRARMDWRAADGTLLVAFDSESPPGNIVLGGAAGTLIPVATAVQTSAAGPGVYSYDLFLTSPGGAVTPILAGKVIVSRRVTLP